MAPKKRKGGVGIKTGAKALEKKLVSKANSLAKDYSPLLPTGCEKYFSKEQKVLAKVQKFVGDEKALSKLSKKGDRLGRAYAGTLLLTVSTNTPAFAVLHLPHGEVSIAYWGQTSKDKLVGVQHYDDPIFRLYSIKDLAHKRKVFVYSLEDKMICTGRDPSPPNGFVGQVLKGAGINVVRKEGQYICPHLNSSWGPSLHVSFVSSGEGVRLCPRCLKSDRSVAGLLISRMAGKDMEKDLRARADLGIVWEGEEHGGKVPLEPRYVKGMIDDQTAFTRAVKEAKEELVSKGILIVAGRGYDTPEEMVDSLDGTDDEKKAVLAILDHLEKGVIADEATANSVLTEVWEEHGLTGLNAVVKDKKLAERLYTERSLDDTGPGQIINEALGYARKKKMLSKLPEYKKLGPLSSLADDMARVFRMEGKKGLLSHIRNAKMSDTRVKSTTYAFLLATGEDSSVEWKYSDNEKEFAVYLKEFASNLLNCNDDEYHDTLVSLVQASGSGEKVARASAE